MMKMEKTQKIIEGVVEGARRRVDPADDGLRRVTESYQRNSGRLFQVDLARSFRPSQVMPGFRR